MGMVAINSRTMNVTQQVSYIITGNHPTREITIEEMNERAEPGWIVSFQRGFEPLNICVVGDGLCESDCEEAAIEFLQKNYPNALKKDIENEEITVRKLP